MELIKGVNYEIKFADIHAVGTFTGRYSEHGETRIPIFFPTVRLAGNLDTSRPLGAGPKCEIALYVRKEQASC